MKPKLIIESHVPCVPEELDNYFEIQRLAPEDITADAVRCADALIVRTRTRCDASLLGGSSVKFVATATIGTDHIDLPWCKANGITVASAPGCNAPAVAQYVLASVISLFPEGVAGKSIGVVGVGHVGTIVAEWSRQLGMNVLTNDPPRAAREPDFENTDLDDIAAVADIITFHVPHTVNGDYPTHHLGDKTLFDRMKQGSVIINSARGPITNTDHLVAAIESGQLRHVVIDCWEGEPNISRKLLKLATIATPHIAGYSLNGKIRATTMAVNALCKHFNVGYVMSPDIPAGAAEKVNEALIKGSYNPMVDTLNLKRAVDELPRAFELQRNSYPLRKEVGQ